MKKTISYVLAASMLVQGCAGRTNITSQPSGAKVFIDGAPVGKTPYSHSDKKIIGSQTQVRLEKPGYETLNTSFSRDEELHVGALIGGLFVWPVLLWVTTYKENHHYQLSPKSAQGTAKPAAPDAPSTNSGPVDQAPPAQAAPTNKAERLRELNSLKEQKLISEQEYNVQRQKILDEK